MNWRSLFPYGVFIIITLSCIYLWITATHGAFTYALDDAYIHLAIGKNLAEHGVWGVTKYEFSSASSSPLWTLLLAILYHTIHSWYIYVPISLNILSALGIIVIVQKILKQAQVPDYISLAALGILNVCLPFFPLIAGGMENTLFAFFVISSMYVVSIKKEYSPLLAFILVLCMTATRYEGAFVSAGLSIPLLYKRQWKPLALIIVSTCIPILGFGLYFYSQGGYFFPNSVLLKGNIDGGIIGIARGMGYSLKVLLYNFSPLPPLLVFLCVLLSVQWKKKASELSLICTTVLTFIFHLGLAQFGWLYRYEAYLIVMAIVTISLSHTTIRTIFSSNAAMRYSIYILIIGIIGGTILRTIDGYTLALRSARDIYLQHRQIAEFIKQYFPDNSIALNDIGAVCFFNDIHCTDTYGLATFDIARAKKSRIYTPLFLEKYCKKNKVEIALVYDEWLRSGYMYGKKVPGGVPQSWLHVGTFVLGHNDCAIGGDKVACYAIKPDCADTLRHSLQQFARTMKFGSQSYIIINKDTYK